MKNRKTILYINIFVILFAIITIVLKFSRNQYFTLISIALASLSIIFLIVAILMLISEKSQKKETLKAQIKKDENLKEEEKINVENKYKELLSNIDWPQSQEDILEKKIRSLAEEINLVAGLFYWIENNQLQLKNTYALIKEEYKSNIEVGSGLTGQVAKNGQYLKIRNLDKINIEVTSGLGLAKPKVLYILPILKEKVVVAVVELATFSEITDDNINILIKILSDNEK